MSEMLVRAIFASKSAVSERGKPYRDMQQDDMPDGTMRRTATCSLDAVDAFHHGAYLILSLGVQQQARARLHAGDALHGVQRRASLHRHELPADRAVVVGLPADAAGSSSARNRSGTVTPCVKADTLMRARLAGVTSRVRRAVPAVAARPTTAALSGR